MSESRIILQRWEFAREALQNRGAEICSLILNIFLRNLFQMRQQQCGLIEVLCKIILRKLRPPPSSSFS